MDHQVIVSDYTAMDRVLREERAYILNIVKQIKKAGCNVLLIQKSILRWAPSLEEERAGNLQPPNSATVADSDVQRNGRPPE